MITEEKIYCVYEVNSSAITVVVFRKQNNSFRGLAILPATHHETTDYNTEVEVKDALLVFFQNEVSNFTFRDFIKVERLKIPLMI